MAQSYRSKFLSVLRQNEQRMTEAFTMLARGIVAEIISHANGAGIVPRTASVDLQQMTMRRVMSFFIGRNRDGQPAPFDLLPNGSVFPLSTYMRILWTGITDAARIPVEQNAAMLTKRLPPDVLGSLRVARLNPFEAARSSISEIAIGKVDFHTLSVVVEQIFRPNPLAKYDPPHQWVDPNGYRLSDRIWNTAGSTRTRLDAFLEDSIRRGVGALEMSKELETFLIPGRSLRTSKPYGTDASFDAMRLARTEISRAHAGAAEMSAAMNPFVQGLKWNLSGSHAKLDICDYNAAGGPYSIDNPPTMPAHPHCLCYWSYEMVDNPQATLDAMREDVRRARSELVDFIGPVLAEQFLALLLGGGLSITRRAQEPEEAFA